MAYCVVAPGLAGEPTPHSPFPDSSWLYVNVPDPSAGAQPTFEVIAQPPANNPQAFNSGAYGNPSNEDIWAFESNRLACIAAAMAATSQNLSNTVQGLNRPDWEARIGKLNAAMQDVYTQAKGLCDAVNDVRSK